MVGLLRLLLAIVRRLLAALTTGLASGAGGVWAQIRRWRRAEDPCESERDRRSIGSRCVPIDRPEFLRPDPLIYAQYYLSELGNAVTWNNPDIQLYRDGVAVPSEKLEAATTYEVVARIWNGSPHGPAINMPVHFVFRDFGVGTLPIPIGSTTISVGVKGGPGQPAFASQQWTTPAKPGHYCLQVLLDPVDDLNPLNNLGQENTNVGRPQSPAVFAFTLRNESDRPQRYRFDVDGYVLPEQPSCGAGEGERERVARLARHRQGQHPLPAGWDVDLEPSHPHLEVGQSITVRATITPPAGFRGEQAVNVNAFFDDDRLAGGVTLRVVATGEEP